MASKINTTERSASPLAGQSWSANARCGGATSASASQRKVRKAQDKASERSRMQECLENCLDCSRHCFELIPHCLEQGGTHANSSHITLLMSCALSCETSAQLMMLKSPFHSQTCGACADICLKCAEDCERLGVKDEMMNECAAICRLCAESCEIMAGLH